MSTSKSFAGSTYNLPLNREPKSSDWGTNVSNFLIAVADQALAKTGGSFTLAAEMNLGATWGLLLPYIKSASANIAAAGVVRLANLNTISWRNAANGADVALSVSAADRLTIDTVVVPTISSTDTLTNKSISGATNTLSAIPNSATTAVATNTNSTIVARDGSGNFAAGTITAALTGNVTGNLTGNVTGNVSGTSGSTTGNAATVTTNANLTGDVTSVGNATTLATVPIAKGGTGQTSANAALNALLPSQATHSGKVLGTNATDAAWVAALTTTLADGAIFLGNVSNVATAVTPSGDVTMTNAGVTAITAGAIVNADISGSAAIDGSKIVSASGSVAGVVTTGTQTFAGAKVFSGATNELKGRVDGAGAPAGYIGERPADVSGTLTAVNKTTYSVSSAIPVPAGSWDIYVMCSAAAFGDAATVTGSTLIFSTNSSTASTGGVANVSRIDYPATTAAWGAVLGPIRINVSGSTNYYFKQIVTAGTATSLQTAYNVIMNRAG